MESGGPSKPDTDQIFNRLRTIPANKSCFDCSAKNPTWASITYGVFICIDCSAVHRGLGVHLTFVKSTNLDINWSWQQIRQMQCGGNANASAFFRQHNCSTTDAQQKYNSRAAQLYRDKLVHLAQQACRRHGTNLHIDSHHHDHEQDKKEEVDFFAEHSNDQKTVDNNGFNTESNHSKNNNSLENCKLTENSDDASPSPRTKPAEAFSGAPSVDLLNSINTEPVKSTIGVRKIQPKKSGLGTKKGLGATKVKTNFADIEHRANMADQHKLAAVTAVSEKPLTAEEEAEALVSVRLAYQDLSMKQQREEEKMKAIDPNKARQMERLGMGFSNSQRNAVSHSFMTDMQVINQEAGSKFSNSSKVNNYDRDTSSDFFDDYSYISSSSGNGGSTKDYGRDTAAAMGFETIEPIQETGNVRSMFDPMPASKKSDDMPSSRSYNSGSGRNQGTPKGSYELDDAQKKFGSAKGISSDQFFGNDSGSSYGGSGSGSTGNNSNLSRFQGSNSISSADYFGDGTGGSNNTSGRRGRVALSYNGPDLDDVKESVKEGVAKVAGRLSSVMSSIQDKYGY